MPFLTMVLAKGGQTPIPTKGLSEQSRLSLALTFELGLSFLTHNETVFGSKGSIVEKGLNSDVSIEGFRYHLQTEDWGTDNPFLVSRIYKEGQVVQTVKRSYREVFRNGPSSTREALRLALRAQHLEILDLLISGQLPR